jgi:hypothetical protein
MPPVCALTIRIVELVLFAILSINRSLPELIISLTPIAAFRL